LVPQVLKDYKVQPEQMARLAQQVPQDHRDYKVILE
jgi:hypothetical protein